MDSPARGRAMPLFERDEAYSDHGEEGRWDGSAAEPPDLWERMDPDFDSADGPGAVRPEDEVEPTPEMIAELSRPRGAAPARPREDAERDARPEPTRGLGSGSSQPEPQVEPAARNMASLDMLAALARIGKTKGPAERFDAYLSVLPVDNQHALRKFMVEFEFKPNDPEIVIGLLMGHIVALGKTIPAAIDAGATDAVGRIADAMGATDELAGRLERMLAQAIEISERASNDSMAMADKFAETLGEKLREAALASVEVANKQVIEAMNSALSTIRLTAKSKAEELAKELGAAAAGGKAAVDGAALKAASDVVGIVRAEIQKIKKARSQEGEATRWKAAAMGLGAFVAGMLAMACACAARAKGWL